MVHFLVDFHHGGNFDENEIYKGTVSEWRCDSEYWSYFEVTGLIKEMGYTIDAMWYKVGGELKLLRDDNGTAEMLEWAKEHGNVLLYLIHPIYQPQPILLLDNRPLDTQTAPQTFETQEVGRTFKAHINEPVVDEAQTVVAEIDELLADLSNVEKKLPQNCEDQEEDQSDEEGF